MKTILTLALLLLMSCAKQPIAIYSYEMWIYQDTVIVDEFKYNIDNLDSLQDVYKTFRYNKQ